MVSAAKRDSLKESLKNKLNRKAPTNPIATSLVSSYSSRFTDELGIAAGLKKDITGNLLRAPGSKGAFLSTSEAAALTGQAKVDVKIIANELLRSMPNASDEEIRVELTKRLEEWWRIETQTSSGKYYMKDIVDIRNSGKFDLNRFTPEQINRLRNRVGFVEILSTSSTAGSDNSLEPKDLVGIRQIQEVYLQRLSVTRGTRYVETWSSLWVRSTRSVSVMTLMVSLTRS